MVLWTLKKLFCLLWPVTPSSLRVKLSSLIERVQRRSAVSIKHSAIEVICYSEAEFYQAKTWEAIEGVAVSRKEIPSSYPNFSLITTCYNEAATVGRWLDSVLLLELLPNDLVICDGGSSDDTVQQIKRWQALHPTINFPIDVISGERRNIAAGRNEAVRRAKCEIVLCSDVGTVLDSKWSLRMVAPFSYNLELDAVFGWYQVAEQGVLRYAKVLQSLFMQELSEINPATFLPSARSIAFKKAIYQQLGGYPEHLTRAGEDTLFDIALKEQGGNFAFVPEAYVVWQPPLDISKTVQTVFSYSRGDAEAGMFWGHYLGQLGKVAAIALDLLVVVLLLWSFGSRAALLAALFLCSIAYIARSLLKPYVERMKRAGVVEGEVEPWWLALLFVVAQSAGFLRGLL